MKDPLDNRNDAYQCFNEEARAQGKPPQVHYRTGPMDVRRLFGPIRAKSKNPSSLQDAYDKLTRVEKRLEEDIYFYWVEEQNLANQPLAEPDHQWEQPVPLPSVSVREAFVHTPHADDQVLEPIRFRDLQFSHLSRYDEAGTEWEIKFDQ